jgi:apolipoprotein N-acyltransferase
MSKSQQGLLTAGALIIIIAIVIIAAAIPSPPISWWEVIPLIVAFYGCWLIVAAGIRTQNPSKYERSAFSLFGWGMLVAAIGFGWDFNVRGMSWVYTFAVVLLLLGILAVVAALKPKPKKA